MARDKTPTQAELTELLDRLSDVSIDVSDMTDRIAKSFGLNLDNPSALTSQATASARTVADLASKLAIVARHKEDREQLERQLRQEARQGA